MKKKERIKEIEKVFYGQLGDNKIFSKFEKAFKNFTTLSLFFLEFLEYFLNNYL